MVQTAARLHVFSLDKPSAELIDQQSLTSFLSLISSVVFTRLNHLAAVELEPCMKEGAESRWFGNLPSCQNLEVVGMRKY